MNVTEPVSLYVGTTIDSNDTPATNVSIRIPLESSNGKLVERLLSTPAQFSGSYRAALERVYAVGGILNAEQVSRIVEAGDELPRLRISNGVATVSMKGQSFEPWIAEEDGSSLSLALFEVPPGEHVEVALRAKGSTPMRAYPLPIEDSTNGTLRWSFAPGISPLIGVQLSEPVHVVPPYDRVYPVALLAVAAVPFVLLLLLGVGAPTISRPPRWLSELATAGILLSLGCIAVYVYEGLTTIEDTSTFRIVRALLPASGLLAFVVLSGSRRLLSLLTVSALSIGFALLVAPHASLQLMRVFDLRSAHFFVRGERGDVELAAACLLAGLLTAAVFIASVRWLLRILPGLWQTLRDRVRFPRVGVGVAIAALVLVVVTQLLLATRAQDRGVGFVFGEPGWAAALGGYLDVFTFVLANLSQGIAFTLFGIGLSAWLWRRVGDGEAQFEDWRESATLVLLFATMVTGLGGELDGYPAPIPFVLSFLGLGVAIHALAGTARGRLAIGSAAKQAATDLLRRATGLAVLRRQRHAVANDLLSNEIDEERHVEEIRDLDSRHDALTGSSALLTVDAENRSREALALGLIGPGGAQSRLRTLMHRGWWIFAVAAVYTVYALIHLAGPGAVSASRPEGLAFLASSIVNQAIMWPIAAWCFVLVAPILPGRTGLLKGLVAGAFTALPPGLASLALDNSPGGEQWLSLSAELTLLYVAIGFVLDYRAVRSIKGDLRQLGELYSITNLRAAVAYVAPLGLLLFSVIHGLASGKGASALEELASHASTLVPGLR